MLFGGKIGQLLQYVRLSPVLVIKLHGTLLPFV